ncbi:MAG: KOW domain-containing RNA-binding protein [Firmicutes bacterium]|nr:KOW domain-containing RNA-binding protein [Bacillota bacterium]
MSDEAVQVGRLVSSIQGRDSGRFYLVVGAEGGTMVRVADGEGRRVEKPKRKNIKHLRFYHLLAEELAEKARTGKRVSNVDVRKAIKSMVETLQK